MAVRHTPEKCIVVCPAPYWRKGNVDFICKMFGIVQFDILEDALDYVIEERRYKK